MSKSLTEAQITTRNARSKLARGVHWRSIDPDTHLGYRKGARGGRWLVRWYRGDGAYAQETLATADDAFAADGRDSLDFSQAVTAARKHVAAKRDEAQAKAEGPLLTVKDAADEYIAGREARETAQAGESGLKRDARSRLTRYVLAAEIAAKPLRTLDADALRQWREGLPKDLAPGTVRRLINDFKAALNHAGQTHRKRVSPEMLLAIKEGLKAGEARAAVARRQILSDDEVRALLSAAAAIDAEHHWEGDLSRVIAVLAATGARFSQISRMTVADVQRKECRLMIPVSRKGRGEKHIQQIGFRVGADVIAALAPAIKGRRSHSSLFERWRHKQTGPAEWVRDARGPWTSASELRRAWTAIVERAGLPADAVPYALRHSSIVRQLRAGLPTRLVAALHDTSSAMIEKHYAAFIVDAMDELAARAITPLLSSLIGAIDA
jgi:integrase